MEAVLGGLFIFLLRISDVSIGTLRLLYTVRGRKVHAAALGFIEALVFIAAVSSVLSQPFDWYRMVGYASGFAVGTMVGMSLEGWLAGGWLTLRIISKKTPDMIHRLRDANFGVTAVEGEGKHGEVLILFVVCQRRRGKEAMRLILSIDDKAFVTVDPVHRAIGGYLPRVNQPAISLRK